MLIGAFEPKQLERAARIGDGIMPASGGRTTLEKLGNKVDSFRNMVRDASRDPERMIMILNFHTFVGETKTRGPCPVLGGTPQEIADDLPGVKNLGIHHIFFDLNYPAAIPIETQLLLLRKLVQNVKS